MSNQTQTQLQTQQTKSNDHAVLGPLAAVLQDELVHLQARKKHLEHQLTARADAATSEKLQNVQAEIASLERGILALDHRA